MPSITSWSRLEPRARSEDMQRGLLASLHDPLWLLARQWQFGEFAGEDAGSPVAARLRGQCARLSRYHPGPLPDGGAVTGQPYDGRSLPLETLVEGETVTAATRAPGGRFAAQSGLHFLRMLAAEDPGSKYRGDYIRAYPVSTGNGEQSELDDDSVRFLELMSGRAPHGLQLYEDLRGLPRQADGAPKFLPADPVIEAGDQSRVAQAAGRWLAWMESLFKEPTDDNQSWVSRRMEYSFAVSTCIDDSEVVLEANEYTQGHLDWYAFNTRADATLNAQESDVEAESITRTVIPAPVTFRGMPASRWWEFEDAAVDFGALDTAPEDLGKLLFMEFALTYGNDWFSIPVDVPVGSLCRIRSLVVTDTFGERLLIQPYSDVDAPSSRWRFLSVHTNRPGDADASDVKLPEFLFLPPALGIGLHSAPLEEVLLIRDEMANMAWAVERIVESPTGRRLNRFEALQQLRRNRDSRTPAAAPTSSVPAYRLTTEVPDYWIPLVPVRDPDGGVHYLKRGRLLQVTGDAPTLPRPLGEILQHDDELVVLEEEVSRSGARITRSYQYARWIDGATFLWVGRRKMPGAGEGWSGLRFDVVE